jgi:hypothetical protein
VKWRAGFVTAALVVGLSTAACANPTYDSGSTHRQLVAAGLTDKQASCVVEGMNRRFPNRTLNAHATVTRSQRKAFAKILTGCGVTPKANATRSS